MSALVQEFFWTPCETISWLKRAVPEFRLWVALWIVGGDAELIDVDQLRPDTFCGRSEDSVQIFLGDETISVAPVWRESGGKRLLDFQNSYAVQLVAPVIGSDRETLLQGQLAILRLDQYRDQGRASKLSTLFRSLQSSLKQASDHTRVLIQPLPSGKEKIWKHVLVGKGVPGADIKRLKQFTQGEVTFRVAVT